MSRAIRIVITVILACICQTDLVKYIRIATIAPDMLTVFLVLLTGYTGAYGGFLRRQPARHAVRCERRLRSGDQSGLLHVHRVGVADAAPRNEREAQKSKTQKLPGIDAHLLFLTLMREIVYIGYLFLIGAEQSMVTILRALLCAAYSSAMILPGSFVVHKIMSVHPFKRKHGDDLTGDSDVMGNNR